MNKEEKAKQTVKFLDSLHKNTKRLTELQIERLKIFLEKSVVCKNLMTEKGYTGYCGDELCKPRTISSPERWPRTVWVPELNQFRCPKCGWVSRYPKEFINLYKIVWDLS